MNNVTLIGRLTKDPEVRWNNDLAIGRFILAVNRPPRNGQDNGADFIRVVVFGKMSENCEKYLGKGSQVGISGRIQTGNYKNDNGETIYTTDVVAERVEFLSRKQGSGQESQYDGFEPIDDCPF